MLIKKWDFYNPVLIYFFPKNPIPINYCFKNVTKMMQNLVNYILSYGLGFCIG